LDRLKGLKGAPERGNWPGFGIWVLHDHAIVACQGRLNALSVWPQHHHARFDLDGLEDFQNAHCEWKTEEVQKGLGRAHPGRPASRQDDAC
jgi:hypothetical protein